MDTELVKRAQHGDREAFALIAAGIATRFLAISRRILRHLDLAEDATQQALVAVWRDLPQLRDPARFDAWSYRLLVRACYSEGRAARCWSPGLRQLPENAPETASALDEVIDRDQLERGIRRLSADRPSGQSRGLTAGMRKMSPASVSPLPDAAARQRGDHSSIVTWSPDSELVLITTGAPDAPTGPYAVPWDPSQAPVVLVHPTLAVRGFGADWQLVRQDGRRARRGSGGHRDAGALPARTSRAEE